MFICLTKDPALSGPNYVLETSHDCEITYATLDRDITPGGWTFEMAQKYLHLNPSE